MVAPQITVEFPQEVTLEVEVAPNLTLGIAAHTLESVTKATLTLQAALGVPMEVIPGATIGVTLTLDTGGLDMGIVVTRGLIPVSFSL